jgi:carboxymethylenebutenolidase
MTPESTAAFVAVQRDRHEAHFPSHFPSHIPSHSLAHPGAQSPVVQIEQYDAAYGFDDAGSRQHDPLASQSARLKTNTFFDKFLNF